MRNKYLILLISFGALHLYQSCSQLDTTAQAEIPSSEAEVEAVIFKGAFHNVSKYQYKGENKESPCEGGKTEIYCFNHISVDTPKDGIAIGDHDYLLPLSNFTAKKDVFLKQITIDLQNLPMADKSRLQGDFCIFSYHRNNPGPSNLFCSVPVITDTSFKKVIKFPYSGLKIPSGNIIAIALKLFNPIDTEPDLNDEDAEKIIATVSYELTPEENQPIEASQSSRVLRIPYLDASRNSSKHGAKRADGFYNLLPPNWPWLSGVSSGLKVVGFKVYFGGNGAKNKSYKDVCLFKRSKSPVTPEHLVPLADKRCLPEQNYVSGESFPKYDEFLFEDNPLVLSVDDILSASCYVKNTEDEANLGGDCAIYPVINNSDQIDSKYIATQFWHSGFINQGFLSASYCNFTISINAKGDQVLENSSGAFELSPSGLGSLLRILQYNSNPDKKLSGSREDWMNLPEYETHKYIYGGTLPNSDDYDWACNNLYLLE